MNFTKTCQSADLTGADISKADVLCTTTIGEYDIYEYIEQSIRGFSGGSIKDYYNARPVELEYLSLEEFSYYVEDYMRSL